MILNKKINKLTIYKKHQGLGTVKDFEETIVMKYGNEKTAFEFVEKV